MANEAGLASVLSAAHSLKHETDMKKSFPSQEEAFDKAKQMGLRLIRRLGRSQPLLEVSSPSMMHNEVRL